MSIKFDKPKNRYIIKNSGKNHRKHNNHKYMKILKEVYNLNLEIPNAKEKG